MKPYLYGASALAAAASSGSHCRLVSFINPLMGELLRFRAGVLDLLQLVESSEQ